MTHPNNGFDKIERSAQCLYGPRKLLLCGFSTMAQTKFITLLDMLELKELPLIWAARPEADKLLSDIFSQPDNSGGGRDSDLPRAIIAAGIEQQELHRLMNACRQSGMQKSLWAVLTPTSEHWPLSQLLDAIAAEAMAVAKKKAKKY